MTKITNILEIWKVWLPSVTENPVGFARVDATELWQTLDTSILLYATYRIICFYNTNIFLLLLLIVYIQFVMHVN